MAQRRNTSTNRTRNGRTGNYRQNIYTEGSAARRLDIAKQMEEAPRRQLSNETRKNREKAHHMSFGYVAFLLAALCLSGLVLINYVQLQAELTTRVRSISDMEKTLNNLKLENDEEYSRITSSIDLEEIKRIAIGELGMTYAKEGQIILYTNEGNDYMRQVAGNSQ